MHIIKALQFMNRLVDVTAILIAVIQYNNKITDCIFGYILVMILSLVSGIF